MGYLRGEYGLSIAARNTVHVLSSCGRIVEEVPISPTPDARPLQREDGARDVDAACRVNVFELNPDDVFRHLAQWRDALHPGGRNVCIPFWELPLVPRRWEPLLSAMDAVLAPTRFIESACKAAVPNGRIIHYPQAVFVPDSVRASREEWGLRRDATVFVVSFDVGSDIDRKNPWAAIEAFRGAFPSDRDVQLVIKMRPWDADPRFRAQAEDLRALAGSDRRIRIIDESLPYERVLCLYASCDVLVSLHRSEGLGLHLMEAMTLGKVVVATDWSGNLDFMRPDDSIPIPYRLVPVATRHPAYATEVGRPGQMWAEPAVSDAIDALRALHRDPARRSVIGAAASRHMAQRAAEMVRAAPFDSLETLLSGWHGHPGRLSEALRRATRRQWARNSWNQVIGTLGALRRRLR